MKCTDRAVAILAKSREYAVENDIIAVLIAIMTVEEGVGQHVLNDVGVRRQDVVELFPHPATATTPSVDCILQHAEHEASELDHPYVGSEHLLLACLRLLEGKPEEPRVRRAIPIDYAEAKRSILTLLGRTWSLEEGYGSKNGANG